MICVGLGYMFEHQVQEAYEEQGLEMANDPRFWDTYRISYLQLRGTLNISMVS